MLRKKINVQKKEKDQRSNKDKCPNEDLYNQSWSLNERITD